MAKTPNPPGHLQAETRRWWSHHVSEYHMEPHHVRLLTLAAESWDRCQEARAALAKHGITYKDRFDQPKARPEVAIERDSRIAFARLVRELNLDLSAPEETRMPRLTA
jgi:P27 family predicted phage terminase small subunit